MLMSTPVLLRVFPVHYVLHLALLNILLADVVKDHLKHSTGPNERVATQACAQVQVHTSWLASV